MTCNSIVHSNDMACRKRGRLGLEPVIGCIWGLDNILMCLVLLHLSMLLVWGQNIQHGSIFSSPSVLKEKYNCWTLGHDDACLFVHIVVLVGYLYPTTHNFSRNKTSWHQTDRKKYLHSRFQIGHWIICFVLDYKNISSCKHGEGLTTP